MGVVFCISVVVKGKGVGSWDRCSLCKMISVPPQTFIFSNQNIQRTLIFDLQPFGCRWVELKGV